METCGCGGAMVWVRILSNNHRTLFCVEWIAREAAEGRKPFFIVEGALPSLATSEG